MVVDDVQRNGETPRVGRIHKFLQVARGSIGVLRREEKDAVVAPIASTGELSDRHQLYGCYANIRQSIEMGNERGERALRRECANMKFVEDTVLERGSPPVGVA